MYAFLEAKTLWGKRFEIFIMVIIFVTVTQVSGEWVTVVSSGIKHGTRGRVERTAETLLVPRTIFAHVSYGVVDGAGQWLCR